MDRLTVRRAEPGDMGSIAAISRSTWDGEDYLEEAAPGWMLGEGFHVGVLDGKVIGTFRITEMPDGVLWLEGLRVHPSLQGRGLGRNLSDAAWRLGKQAIGEGRASRMEFSTYFLNVESIHLALSRGFRQVCGFLCLGLQDIPCRNGVDPIDPSDRLFTGFRGHIPVGWKAVLSSLEGIQWLHGNARFGRFRGATMLRAASSAMYTPLAGSEQAPDDFLNGVEADASAGGDNSLQIVLRPDMTGIRDAALKKGYTSWDPVEDVNMVVYRWEQGSVQV